MDIISLNETRLDSSSTGSTNYIHNYGLLRNERNHSGGGVALYNKQHLYPSKVDTDLATESVWAYVQVKGKKLVIGSVYRPPSSTAKYYSCGLSTATIEYSCPFVCLCVYTKTQKIMV